METFRGTRWVSVLLVRGRRWDGAETVELVDGMASGAAVPVHELVATLCDK